MLSTKPRKNEPGLVYADIFIIDKVLFLTFYGLTLTQCTVKPS